MAALFSQLPLSLTSTTEGTEPETRMEQVAAEGEGTSGSQEKNPQSRAGQLSARA